ncbi:MAG TPA: efflux RND transporter periplasmic adaptor subunit [Planctomycetaceae bacterium]|nr:efflux RND transporter periplasmic adaptor subunit [Planctomycetaceae bacterium]
MVSRKTTQALILGAAILAGFASWRAVRSNSDQENVRPAVEQANGNMKVTRSADHNSGLASNATSAFDATRAINPNHATPTSALQTKSSEDSGGIEAFTEPYRDVAIAASEMGTLSGIKVKEGDTVEAGDMIAVMSDEVLKASLEVARRSMNVEGTLQSAIADVNLRRRELEKLQQLRQRDHASQQEVDRVQTELTVAEARHLSVREELEIKHLEFCRIEAQLEQRCIRAPIGGIVSEVKKESGEFVSPSDPVVARIVQLDPLLIVFSVPLVQRNAFHQDETVKLTLGNGNQSVQGTIEYVAQTTDSSNSSVRVKVRVPNPNGEFQSGERAVLMPDSATSPAQPASSPGQTSSPLADRTNETPSRQ